jgi:D-alanyl-D-alanine carboxypeptidase (penicillin-binding protein 5/6)
MEAVDSGALNLDDLVSVSANAASMGGSQIYLEEGETMSVEEMLKSVIISSANDAAVALAEHVAGSEQAFVQKMNDKALELGMENTYFENTNGLDDSVTKHLTSARDIAIMSRELIKHEKILEDSSLWMDTIRNGTFGLTNTNRLVRFYNGATGLKTGSTAKAKFCVSATAKRGNMHLICVIMGAPTRDERNAMASKLLDYGFANYSLFVSKGQKLDEIKVVGGVDDSCGASSSEYSVVVKKGEEGRVATEFEIQERLTAPVKIGDTVGRMVYKLGDKIIGENKILATESIEKIKYTDLLKRFVEKVLIK